MSTLRFAIVGCGGIAKAHLVHWLALPGTAVVGLADSDPGRALALAQACHLPADLVQSDLDAVLARRPDVVAICTPPFLHVPMAEQVLRAGAHAVVEKPLCGNAADFDRLLTLERETGRRVLPVLQNRCGEGVRQLRALAAAGLAGALLHGSIDTVWRRIGPYYDTPWRRERDTAFGGPLIGLAVHALDVALQFAPRPLLAISHRATLARPINVEDFATGILVLENRGALTLTASVHAQREHSRGLLAFEQLQVEWGDDTYGWAARPWRISVADPTHRARVEACLKALPADPVPEGLEQLWWRQVQIWDAICRGGDATGNDLASARPAHAAVFALYAAAAATAPVSV